MASVTNSPGTMADDATVGTVAWTNPDNAKVSDNTRAFASMSASTVSHYLKSTNFGFSLPADATIGGIVVEIERKKTNVSGSPTITDNEVKIIKGGVIGSTNKSLVPAWSTTEAYFTYGSSSDLWGETWTYTDINDSGFGVVLSVGNINGSSSADVDHIRITVYYTTGPTDYSMSVTNSSISLTGQTLGVTSARTIAITTAMVAFLGQAISFSFSGMTNLIKPTSSMTNSLKASFAELWSTILTTWATETRTWTQAGSLMGNSAKVTSSITNTPKP